MDFFKVPTNYWNGAALISAGEKAEVLYLRAKAHCADLENDGFVHKDILPRLTPTSPAQRAAALVREELWVPVDGGYQFTDWDQITRAELEEKRADAAARQKRHRTRKGSTGVTGSVTRDKTRDSRGSHRTEVEEEVEVAACGSNTREPLPPPLEILRAALEARKLVVRWDRLTTQQTTEIEDLIEAHGDAALVASAVRDFRPDSPAAFAQAWLPSWRQLRKPGDLAAVPDQPCPEPGHAYAGGTTRRCTACAAEGHTRKKESN